MFRFLLRRTVEAAIALWIISLLVFVLTQASGDPLSRLLSLEAGREEYLILQESYGLDRPLHVQYGLFIKNAVQGDLGISFRTGRPVTFLLAERLPNSFRLAAVAIGIVLVVSVPLGVFAAVQKDRGWDTTLKIVAFLGQSIPSFWISLVLILFFSVRLGWLPTSGMGTPWHFVMPAFTLSLFGIAGIMRLLRSGMLDVLGQEYIKLARLKGLKERRVIWIHALRNAAIPAITFAGFYFALLVGAAIVVEVVFVWPGMGRLAFEALLWRDFPVIQGVVLITALIVILVNMLVDIVYAFIDPRIRY